MHCPRCGAVVDASDAHCRACGASLSPGAPGLEERARAIVAEEREAERRAALDRARHALEAARSHLEELRCRPRPRARLTLAVLVASFVLACALGLPAGCVVEGVSQRAPLRHALLPHGLRRLLAAGRAISWSSTVNFNQHSDPTRAFCPNRRVDVDELGFQDVTDQGTYQAIELSWWLRMPPLFLLLTLVGCVALPSLGARLRRGADARELREVTARVAALEGAAAPAPPADAAKPYRA